MDIPPVYIITSEILSLVSEIESLRLYAQKTNLQKEVSFILRRNSLLKSSLYSARIEGNQLSEQSINENNSDPETQEVVNIMKAFEFIESTSLSRINLQYIQNVHAIIGNNIFPERGIFRTEVSAIFNTSGTAIYMPPPPTQILPLMTRLMEYISIQNDFPLITAFIAHLIFEKIHPFIDGNGRVGRVLIIAILKNKQNLTSFPVIIEEYLDMHRDKYYDVLLRGLQDPESYLIFMLHAYLNAMKQTINRLEVLSHKPPEIQQLSARQEEIFNIIQEHTVVTLNLIARRFLKVSERTLRDDLAKLMKKKLVIKIGNTKGVEYRINKK